MTEQRQATPTRGEYLGLKEERQLMLEGYQFLDEKRIILAHEILRQLAVYREAKASYSAAHGEAVELLAAAAVRHGLEGLSVYPPRLVNAINIERRERRFLGLELIDFGGAAIEAMASPAPPAWPSPEAELCSGHFAGLAKRAAELACRSANLWRLLAEYRRTERRARALENVLLPDIDASIRFMEEQLEAIDQEESLQVRFVGLR